MDQENEEVVLGTNLGTKKEQVKKTVTVRFEFTFYDFLLMSLIISGIVLAGVCYNASEKDQCGGIDELGEAGIFMIIGGFVPYILVFVLNIFNFLKNTK